MANPHPAALWLLKTYNAPGRAIGVAGCFHRTFTAKDGETVLEDLRRFCSIYDTTAERGPHGIDQVQMNINEGRRQAYIHIVSLLGVSEADLNIESRNHDERSDRRGGDGSEPRPRYSGDTSPGLDGAQPVASTSSDAGGGDDDTDAGSVNT